MHQQERLHLDVFDRAIHEQLVSSIVIDRETLSHPIDHQQHWINRTKRTTSDGRGSKYTQEMKRTTKKTKNT